MRLVMSEKHLIIGYSVLPDNHKANAMIDTTFLENDVPKLLSKLQADTPALWGKMSAQHMLEHICMVFALANGSIEAQLTTSKEHSEKTYRHTFIYKNNFPKNLPIPGVPPAPAPLIFGTIDEAKAALLTAIDTFFAYHKDRNITCTHIVLGDLNFEEWVFFQTKHISHHFTQFGLLEGEIHLDIRK